MSGDSQDGGGEGPDRVSRAQSKGCVKPRAGPDCLTLGSSSVGGGLTFSQRASGGLSVRVRHSEVLVL